jgi:hypothetical protein
MLEGYKVILFPNKMSLIPEVFTGSYDRYSGRSKCQLLCLFPYAAFTVDHWFSEPATTKNISTIATIAIVSRVMKGQTQPFKYLHFSSTKNIQRRPNGPNSQPIRHPKHQAFSAIKINQWRKSEQRKILMRFSTTSILKHFDHYYPEQNLSTTNSAWCIILT